MKIFFIPGLLCTRQIWGALNNLRSKYDCYDVDVTQFNSIEKMSDALITSMPSDEVAIIGISMGGYVAIDAALKLGDKLRKLILISTTSNAVNQSTLPERKRAMQLAEQGALDKVVAMSKGICYYKPRNEWSLLEEEMANEIGSEVYLRQQQAIIGRRDYSALVEDIVADTLIVAGKNDKIIPFQDSFFMVEKIKNSNLALLDKCGHLPTLEKSDATMCYVQKFLEE